MRSVRGRFKCWDDSRCLSVYDWLFLKHLATLLASNYCVKHISSLSIEYNLSRSAYDIILNESIQISLEIVSNALVMITGYSWGVILPVHPRYQTTRHFQSLELVDASTFLGILFLPAADVLSRSAIPLEGCTLLVQGKIRWHKDYNEREVKVTCTCVIDGERLEIVCIWFMHG